MAPVKLLEGLAVRGGGLDNQIIRSIGTLRLRAIVNKDLCLHQRLPINNARHFWDINLRRPGVKETALVLCDVAAVAGQVEPRHPRHIHPSIWLVR